MKDAKGHGSDAKGSGTDQTHTAEAQTRAAGKYPVTAHDDQKSVGSHTGRTFGLNLLKALGGVAAGVVGTIGRSALRNQGGRRR